MTDDRPAMRVALHGPDVTVEAAVRTAEIMKKLLAEVGEQLGIPKGAVEWRIAEIGWQCDRCDVMSTTKPDPADGWTYADGNDFCPACTKAALGA